MARGELMCGCRGRHELRNGRGNGLNQILIEEAGEALVVRECVGIGDLDGEFGVGGVAEGLVECGAAGDEELWSSESGERLGEGETLAKEEADGDKGGAWIVAGHVEKIGAGCVEDDGRDVGVRDGELSRE